MHTDRWLDVVFGKGDDDFPFWLLTVRVDIILFLACAALVVAFYLSPARIRRSRDSWAEICGVMGLTLLAAGLRLAVAANLLDFGGVPYSRMLLGYRGYFATAQLYSLFYELTTRDIEQAIFFNRIAGTLTIPLVYLLCRCWLPAVRLLPAIAAFLFAVSPLHILLSASDALAVFSIFLAASSYLLFAAGARDAQGPFVGAVGWVGAFAGLVLLTQVRYENVLLLAPAALLLVARRHRLQLRRWLVPLLPALLFIAIYAYQMVTSGISFQSPIDYWLNLDRVLWHLILNPFFAVPVLLVGSLAVGMARGWRQGVVALLPLVGAGVVCVLTIGEGHGVARIFGNWLILILPAVAYGLALMLSATQLAARAGAIALLLFLAWQPIAARDLLATRHLEILENDRFKALLAELPPGVTSIIVADDELMRREAHSTLEVYRKYAMILWGEQAVAQRVRLVGITEYLEHPEQTRCTAGACVFFFGLPCMEQDVYISAREQCQELLRTHRTSVVERTPVEAAPFVHCSIYTGRLRRQLCDPATGLRHFTVYRIEE